MRTRNDLKFQSGFTLFELVVVLAIISAMVAVALPFCKRSNNGLKIRQAASSIAQVLRYAMELSEHKEKRTKFVFDEKFKSYCLQIEDDENSFEAMEDFTGTERFLDEGIHLFDIEGFDQTGSEYFIIFDPEKPWPEASICLSTSDLTETITIKSKYVEIQENSI